MKTRLLGGGMGMGVRGSRLLMVFSDPEHFEAFTREGMEVGWEGHAVAKSRDAGEDARGGVSLNGVLVYQITSRGLAAEASLAGTKYWKDKELN